MTLQGDLEAAVEPDGVRFVFEVTNDGESTEEITFRDAGKADFVVEYGNERDGSNGDRDSRRECWRYSDGRMFAQVIETERLEPGASSTYECRWDAADPGSYVVRATLRARSHDLEAEREFSVEE